MALNTYNQLILYDNILTGGTVTFSNEDATDVGANVYDYKTSTKWTIDTTGSQTIKFDAGSGNTESVTAFAIQGHNLSSSSSVLTLAHSSDDVTYTDFLTITPTDNTNALAYTSTAADKRYWRITITNCAATSYISNVFIGSALDLQTGAAVGFTPPALGRTDTVLRSISEGGQFLGATALRHELQTEISAGFIPYTWIDANYEALRAHVMTKPFFYAWDFNLHGSEIAYCWLTDGGLPRVKYTHARLCEITLPVNGRLT